MFDLQETGIDGIEDLLSQLSESEIRRVLPKILNTTQRNLTTRNTKLLRQEFFLKSKQIKDLTGIQRAKAADPVAEITYFSTPIPLHKYNPKQRYKGKTKEGKRKKAGLKIKLRRGQSAEVFEHMFMHAGPVFQRVKDAARLPIGVRVAPSIASGIQNIDPNLRETELFARDRMAVNARQEISSLISRRAA